ncbi:MAG: hypothetical protein ABIR05_00050 [Luteimonas sp.]
MRAIFIPGMMVLALAAHSALAQDQKPPERSFVVEQTYWVKPGNEKQFLLLYRKTDLARLQREQQAGGILWIRISEPLLSSGNEAWDLRVTVAWKSPEAALAFAQGSPNDDMPAESRRGSIEETLRRSLIENRTETVVIEHLQ